MEFKKCAMRALDEGSEAERDWNKWRLAFARDKTRREKTAVFLGVDFLKELVASLENGGFDGVRLAYALTPPGDANVYRVYELVATEMSLNVLPDHTVVPIDTGITYVSIPNSSTEPTSLGSPPLKNS